MKLSTLLFFVFFLSFQLYAQRRSAQVISAGERSAGGIFTKGTIIQYLSGTDKDHTVAWDFYCTAGRNSGSWQKIAVPSNWELQGFGAYNYGHDKVKANEQGLYKYKFRTRPEWRGKAIYIVFEGSMTDTEVKINGKSAGPVHQGGFYRFRYEIGSLLNPVGGAGAGSGSGADGGVAADGRAGAGENLLEVTVSKTSANTSINRAERNGDFWIFGGIFRPVYLEIVPATHIERIAINAEASGELQADIYMKGLKTGQRVEGQVQKLNGENVGAAFGASVDTGAGSAESKLRLSAHLKDPLLWNAEFPNLYQLVLSIKDKKGMIVHQIRQRFGFHTLELRKEDGFYVNGVKIIFKGSDRHSFWPETGRTLSHDVDLLDVRLMKEMNMNAVRMSHYPPDQDFLDVCDSLGLYVLDELTGWQASYDTTIGRKLVKELVIRDVNHPSVVTWDNGNEGGWNRGIDNDYALYDPQGRIVIHPWERFNGTNTKHYPDYNYMVRSVKEEKDVFFPTEFMHGLYDGGAGAALDDFWKLMMEHPHGAGGFIWAFLDEGVLRTDLAVKTPVGMEKGANKDTDKKDSVYDTDGNHAPDGIVGPHREKEASFYTIKEIWSPVYIEPQPLSADFNGEIPVENRYAFTDLGQCSFSWKLASFPAAGDKKISYIVNASGQPLPLSLAPGKKGRLALNLPAGWKNNDAFYLTAYGPDHREIFTWSWAIRDVVRGSGNAATADNGGTVPAFRSAPNSSGEKAITTENTIDSLLIVEFNHHKFFFDERTGYLKKVVNARGEFSLSGGPVLAGVKTRLKKFSRMSMSDGTQGLEADYEGEGSLKATWTFAPGQLVKLDYSYLQKDSADYMGITFNYPEDKILGMKWLGRGPYRVWKNRLKGQQFGVWEKSYNKAITGEDWQYPEFSGYHAGVSWVVVKTKESPFIVYSDKPVYLQMLRPGREKAALANNNVEPAFPEGNIGFMSAISPIGTKFQAARTMGPQSQKNAGLKEAVSGTLWFEF